MRSMANRPAVGPTTPIRMQATYGSPASSAILVPMAAYHGSENADMKSNTRAVRDASIWVERRRAIAPANRHRKMYHGFVRADGMSLSRMSRETPPPIPPKTAISRMPTIVKFRKCDGWRASSR